MLRSTWEAAVRDYEIDVQGIVNNAHYFHWLEAARAQCLVETGISFSDWYKKGYNLVLRESNLRYRKSLGPGDTFVVHSQAKLQGRLKIVFQQTIINQATGEVCVEATNTVACVDRKLGKPTMPEALRVCFEPIAVPC